MLELFARISGGFSLNFPLSSLFERVDYPMERLSTLWCSKEKVEDPAFASGVLYDI